MDGGVHLMTGLHHAVLVLMADRADLQATV